MVQGVFTRGFTNVVGRGFTGGFTGGGGSNVQVHVQVLVQGRVHSGVQTSGTWLKEGSRRVHKGFRHGSGTTEFRESSATSSRTRFRDGFR